MQSDLMVGTKIDDYMISEYIGSGRYSNMYRANRLADLRDVAIKVIKLRGKQIGNADFQTYFHKQLAVLDKLQHDHIVPIIDYQAKDDYVYVVSPYIDGTSLKTLLDDAPLPLARVREIFDQVAASIIFAHNHKIFHLNIKPSNLLIDKGGNVVVSDFSVMPIVMNWGSDWRDREFTDSNTLWTQSSVLAYLAPEQLVSEETNERTDVYALGVLLYQLLTSQLPFKSANIVTLIYAHVEKSPESLRELNPDIPEHVEAIILKALAKESQSRYASVGMMAQALNTSLDYVSDFEEVTSYPAIPLPNQTQIASHWRPLIVASVIFVLLVLNVLLLVLNDSDVINLDVLNSQSSADIILAELIVDDEEAFVADVIPSDEDIQAVSLMLEEDEGFIAFIACTRQTEYHAGLARELQQQAQQHEIPLRIYDANEQEYIQVTQIEQALADGAMGFIVCALNLSLLQEQFDFITESNMPLVIFGENAPNNPSVAVRENNEILGLTVGRFAGEIVHAEFTDEAVNVLVLGYPGIPYIEERANGMIAGILELIPDANIVGVVRAGGFDNAYLSVGEILSNNEAFNVILSINDTGSLGAVSALEDAGYDGDSVIIVSIDAEAVVRQHIMNGYFFRGSLQVARTETAQGLLNGVINLLAGNPTPATIYIPPGEMFIQE